MKRLSVNVDHVATLRQARRSNEPCPVIAAGMAERAGACGITVHLREDRRHIQDLDLRLLRKTIKTELNLEMAATEEMIGIAIEIVPDMATIVPEKRMELTTEGGLDVERNSKELKKAVFALRKAGIRVNLFIDPLPGAVRMAKRLDANGVELHTGRYAEAKGRARSAELKRVHEGARTANRIGLDVHAGHGLDYDNVKDIAGIAEIEELAIGFSIISRSVYVGIGRAVKEMLSLIR
ncbi:MAG: pyridoxine 5'-phosphate synthase [Deltaproteobacteria bacterium]|nr:pyridoxine 5'-phosphate synthase [Deltaproteobacteria bacterium]